MAIEAHNNHNVYILGAGFSVTAGLPVMGGFLNRMRDALGYFQTIGRNPECEAIEAVLKYRLDAASAAYWSTLDLENIEQLFSLASAARHKVSQALPTAIAGTLEFCRIHGPDGPVQVMPDDNDIFNKYKPDASRPVRTFTPNAPLVYRQIEEADREGRTTFFAATLLGMLNSTSSILGKNSFISFNYDTLLEDALTRLEVPWTYGFEPNQVNFRDTKNDEWGRSQRDSAISVLKLHGSVNWGHMIGDKIGDTLTVLGSHQNLVEINARPRLVPPTWSKNVEDQISSIWEKSIQQIQTATRIIVIGFSMPETDLHFRYLLAAGLQQNAWLRSILFVNPCVDDLEKRARLILRPSYIDQKLITFAPATVEEFVTATAHRSPLSTGQDFDIGRAPELTHRCWVSTR